MLEQKWLEAKYWSKNGNRPSQGKNGKHLNVHQNKEQGARNKARSKGQALLQAIPLHSVPTQTAHDAIDTKTLDHVG